MRIDLHAHSTASDGTDTPTELVATAAAAGLDVVAITDHDTTAGWVEAVQALPPGLRLVRGAEFSCAGPDGRGGALSLHLLGYLFDPQSETVAAEQRRLADERHRRLRRMAARMAADGYPVDPDELFAGLPADAPVGRPHLARALMRAGVVGSVDEAFRLFLATGRPYYVPRVDTDVVTAVRMVIDAGGVAVFAHPFARSRGPVVTPEVIAELAGHGLAGIEVDHPDHDEVTRAELRGLAGDLGLVVTGSSDYHGTNKSVHLGQETTTPEACEQLLAKATGTPVVGG